ncbi:hypothetical protein ABZ920_01515 [Streptomyces sp. NPDC046831]
MTNNADSETAEQRWDGPWYRGRTDCFEASYLPGAGEDLGCVMSMSRSG